MADINATNLTPETLSTLDGTENIVAFDTAEGKKIPLSVLGDYVVQKLTQTLMGQTFTVQTAINFLKNRTDVLSNELFTAISANDDLNDYVTPGVYSANNNATASSLSNCPASSSFKLIVSFIYGTSETGNSRYLQQKMLVNGGSANTEYIRRAYSTNGGSTWTFSSWVQTPTRAEMDAVTSKLAGITSFNRLDNVSASSSKTYVVPASSDHILITTGSNKSVHGVWIVTARSNSNCDITEVITPETLTLTQDSSNFGRLTLASTFTATTRVLDICMYGNAITTYTEPSS